MFSYLAREPCFFHLIENLVYLEERCPQFFAFTFLFLWRGIKGSQNPKLPAIIHIWAAQLQSVFSLHLLSLAHTPLQSSLITASSDWLAVSSRSRRPGRVQYWREILQQCTASRTCRPAGNMMFAHALSTPHRGRPTAEQR